jgi:hypothetical protein
MHPLRPHASRNTLSAARLAPAILMAFAAAGTASAATLSVGPGKTYAAPCAAFAAAKDGDTIEIAGNNTYNGDVCSVSRSNLTIRGVNGRPKINANGKNAAGKGTWVVTGNNITVDNVEMYGATVQDGNGAALRLEGTGFTLRNSFLHDNQNGILSGQNTSSDILVEYSEFGHNGAGDGQTHNLYIGHVKSLTFRYSFSHDANVGHNLKSRAETNLIAYSRFSSLNAGETGSTAAGKPSYEIDLPNAGNSYLIGNVIHQPRDVSNTSMVAYGEEGATNATKNLYVINNTFLNDYTGTNGNFLFISGNVSTPALVQNNIFSGQGTVSSQASAIDKNNYRSAAASFVNRAGWDLRPTASALVINAGSDPGTSVAGVALAPVAQYLATASGQGRTNIGIVDVGAYEGTDTMETAAAVTWTNCANENGTCSFSGAREVRFGASGAYTSKTATGSITCNAAAFGLDPAKNVAKSCSVAGTAPTATPDPSPTPAPTSWVNCASEGATCSVGGTAQVRYGANNSFATKTVTGSIACTNAAFGGDPAHGAVKSCSVATTTTASPAPTAPTWTACASEGATCSFSGKREVRYGTSTIFTSKVVTGPVACTNAVFGDPAHNSAKSCSYSSVTQ